MIPLRDTIPTRGFPLVNYILIGACSVAFLLQVREEPGGDLIEKYGLIPARVLDPDRPITFRERVLVRTPWGVEVDERERTAALPPFTPWLTLLTCMFLHGGWLHFLGNMWFLHIFGDNLEDRLGHLRYLAFYVVAGLTAGAVHIASGPSSTVPTIGASGAIAGVMGGYFLLFPHARIIALLPIFFFFQIFVLPAPIFLGIWFLLQFFQGTFSITSTMEGGVAWWAHIGGFVAGLLLVLFFRKRMPGRRRDGRVVFYR